MARKAGRQARRRRITARDLQPAAVATRTSKTPEEAGAAEELRRREQLTREKAMLEAGTKKIDVLRTLELRGKKLSHTTISNVVAGTSRNADVEAVFCELTRTKPAEMFPARP